MSSLRNDAAKALVPSTASYSREVKDTSRQTQNEILFENNPTLYDKCIICNKATDNRGDHYVSAIVNRMPRFRNGLLIAINHPMNMVPCCKNSQCNSESKKKFLIDTVERYKKFYDYVLENCPCVNITEEEYDAHDRSVLEFMKSRAGQLTQLVAKRNTPITAVNHPHPGPAAPSAAEERAA
jgi:hypothetical protein